MSETNPIIIAAKELVKVEKQIAKVTAILKELEATKAGLMVAIQGGGLLPRA